MNLFFDDLYVRWTREDYLALNSLQYEHKDNWQNKCEKNILFSKDKFGLTIDEKIDLRGFYFDVGLSFQHLDGVDFSYCNTKKSFEVCQQTTNRAFDFRNRIAFSDSIIENCNFAHAALSGCIRSLLSSSCFDYATIDGGGLGVSQEIVNCSFRHVKFQNALLSGLVFRNCDFTGAIFYGNTTVEQCKFIHCTFDKVLFKTTLLKRIATIAPFYGCEFVASPLSLEQKAKLSKTISVM